MSNDPITDLAERFTVYADDEAAVRSKLRMRGVAKACSEAREQCWHDAAIDIKAAAVQMASHDRAVAYIHEVTGLPVVS